MEFTYSNKVGNMRPSIIRELLKQMADPSLISFAGGNPSAEAFPTKEIGEISQKLLEQDPMGTLQYSITEGYPPLVESGREYLNQQGDIMKDTDAMLVTSGSQQVMDFMTKLLCNEGDIVATDDPAFLGALNSFRAGGAHLKGVPLEKDGPDLAVLEQVLSANPKPRFFYTIPNFQNPTGVTTSVEKRRAIYDLCKKYEVPILEDNPYGELRIHSQPVPPIKTFDEDGLVVYAASMSKIFAPGMRVAFCVAQKDLIHKMVTAKQSNDVHTNLWGQRVCDAFLRQYDMKAHLARLRAIYESKADFMCDEFDKVLGNRISYQRPQGGMFVWVTLPEGVDMQEYVKRCLDHRLALVPGNAFMVEDSEPCSSIRVNFSTPTLEQIKDGIQIMDQVLAEMGA